MISRLLRSSTFLNVFSVSIISAALIPINTFSRVPDGDPVSGDGKAPLIC